MYRIDRLVAAKEAATILLKATQGGSLPHTVIDSHAAVAQAWATVAVALGDATIEIDPKAVGNVVWD
jgi:hypothetical protein